ncbi:MAG: RDD family protein [Desulfobacteraceae bacterium]|nr:RDD family protein [Desulfobacteraceae bacterium]
MKKKYYTFPSRGKRLGSFVIDNLIAMAMGNFLFMFFPIKKIMDGLITNNNFNANILITMTLLGFLQFAIIHGYFLQTTGQTIGKKILKLQIVSLDNKQLSLAKLLSLRYFILQAAIPITIYYCLSYNIIVLFFLTGLLSVIDPIFIFGENRRCLHDLIAGTKVVNY